MTLTEQLGEVVGRITESKIQARRQHTSLTECLWGGHESGVKVIAEIKPASPTEGRLISPDDVSGPLRAFERGGASAVSVLVDSMYFGGSMELLSRVRSMTTLPVLAKGVFFEPLHLAECAVAGADACLLMTRVLDCTDASLSELMSVGRALRMEAVVEAATPEEIETVTQQGARLILVNARNIYTDLSIDRRNIAAAHGLDRECVLIAASGIFGPADVEQVYRDSGLRVDAVLVGTHLMKSDDVASSVRELVMCGQNVVTGG
ncbi:MAG: indole-3-glycerol-phosphate synthase [Candidatus Thorarchaeota archaeon]|nr:indole-3-glycerol-phosphate synthase [Candidatus Thorarchaeota archaeon]